MASQIDNASPAGSDTFSLLNTLVANTDLVEGFYTVVYGEMDGAFTSLGHNEIEELLSGQSTGLYSGAGSTDSVGTTAEPVGGIVVVPGEPWFFPIAGSPARGGGSTAVLQAPYSLSTDERGDPRSVSGAVDIGAIEVQPWILTVNSSDNALEIGSQLSLRGAVALANDANGGSADSVFPLPPSTELRAELGALSQGDPISPATIEFTPALAGATIELSQSGARALGATELDLTSPITIAGSQAPGLTISRASGSAAGRLFTVESYGSLTLINVTLSGGEAVGNPGGVGFPPDGGGGGGGAAGLGGAILVDGGKLTLSGVTIDGNEALGGAGASGDLLASTPATYSAAGNGGSVLPYLDYPGPGVGGAGGTSNAYEHFLDPGGSGGLGAGGGGRRWQRIRKLHVLHR